MCVCMLALVTVVSSIVVAIANKKGIIAFLFDVERKK